VSLIIRRPSQTPGAIVLRRELNWHPEIKKDKSPVQAAVYYSVTDARLPSAASSLPASSQEHEM
jgi:hypothetical protein